MNNTKDLEEIKVDPKDAAQEAEMIRKMVRLSPSKRRIMDMSDEMLMQNYALIAHKASSLSSSQRKYLESRLGYAVKNLRIKMEQITDEVNKLTALVEEELNKEITDNGGSNTEQG